MEKIYQNKNIIISLMGILLIILLFLLFMPSSKEKIFNKDIECLNLTRPFGAGGSIHAFYSTKRNSCIFIYSFPSSENPSLAQVFDLSNRAKSLLDWSRNDQEEKLTFAEFIEYVRKQYR